MLVASFWDWFNPVYILHKIIGGVTGGVGNIIAQILEVIGQAFQKIFAAVYSAVLGAVLEVTTHADPLNYLDDFRLTQYSSHLLLPGVVLMAVVVIIAIVEAVIKASPAEIAKRAVVLPLAAAALTAGAQTFVNLLVQFTDWVCGILAKQAFHLSAQSIHTITQASPLTGLPTWLQLASGPTSNLAPVLLVILMALLLIPATIIILLELGVRAMLVMLAVVMLPLFAGALVWPSTRRWLVGMVEKVIALIFSKVILVTILGLSGVLVVATAGEGYVGAMVGSILGLAAVLTGVFALPMALRLVPITIAAAEVHGHGARLATSAASNAAAGFGDATTGASLAQSGTTAAGAAGISAGPAAIAAIGAAKAAGAARAGAEAALAGDDAVGGGTSTGSTSGRGGGGGSGNAGGNGKTDLQHAVGAMSRGVHGGLAYEVGRRLGQAHRERVENRAAASADAAIGATVRSVPGGAARTDGSSTAGGAAPPGAAGGGHAGGTTASGATGDGHNASLRDATPGGAAIWLPNQGHRQADGMQESASASYPSATAERVVAPPAAPVGDDGETSVSMGSAGTGRDDAPAPAAPTSAGSSEPLVSPLLEPRKRAVTPPTEAPPAPIDAPPPAEAPAAPTSAGSSEPLVSPLLERPARPTAPAATSETSAPAADGSYRVVPTPPRPRPSPIDNAIPSPGGSDDARDN